MDFDEQRRELCKKLREIGCCALCTLRFLGETSHGIFYETYDSRTIGGFEDIINPDKESEETCVACLGLLQRKSVEHVIHQVADVAIKGLYDCQSYSLALNFPVNLLVREKSLFLFISENFSEITQELFPGGNVTISLKNVFKWIMCPMIDWAVNKQFNANSPLSIILSFTHKHDDEESKVVNILRGPYLTGFEKRRRQPQPSRNTAQFMLKTVSKEKIRQYVEIPPKMLTESVELMTVKLKHKPIFMAGRYNKLERKLPQTPWIVDGERKTEGSIGEYICEPLVKMTLAANYKFFTSGREDVDVRMLGRGRPFGVELADPHKMNFSNIEMTIVEREINKSAFGKIAIRDLQMSNKELLQHLKFGEEMCAKQYCALCIVDGPLPTNLDTLSTLVPLTITQSTPIRIMHRRLLGAREKTIHKLSATPVSDQKDGKGPSYFKINVEAEAGIYLKEFIHGDIGRTKPKLGDFLGDIDVDVVAMDVEEILLNWPPSVGLPLSGKKHD